MLSVDISWWEDVFNSDVHSEARMGIDLAALSPTHMARANLIALCFKIIIVYSRLYIQICKFKGIDQVNYL